MKTITTAELLKQVKLAAKYYRNGGTDDILTAVEFIENMHDEDLNESELLGFLVCELITAACEYKEHQLEELEYLRKENKALHDQLSDIVNLATMHLG